MSRELGQITSWITREAAPNQVCDRFHCFEVVADLRPAGLACMALAVGLQIFLYCHLIVTPRVKAAVAREPDCLALPGSRHVSRESWRPPVYSPAFSPTSEDA